MSERIAVDAELSERQEAVLRAVVAAYVGEAAPIGSGTVSRLLPLALSAASVRNTMAELAEFGLIEKPHRSAGRVPTSRGLRAFVDRAPRRRLGRHERRDLDVSLEGVEGDAVLSSASRLLSERTRQLGFAAVPRIEDLVLHHVSLVRMATHAILAILVSEQGVTLRPVIEDEESGDQAELDRIAAALNERLGELTTRQLREQLSEEAWRLRSDVRGRVARAARLGARALAVAQAAHPAGLVVPTQRTFLDQPEFRDRDAVRGLLAAVEDREAWVALLDKVIGGGQLRVELGDDLGEPVWRGIALVAAPYRSGRCALGAIGVIGPSRMDYPRIMALVDYLSGAMTEKLGT